MTVENESEAPSRDQAACGEATAGKMGVAFLGTLPFDGSVVGAGDSGRPIVSERPSSQFSKALEDSVAKIIEG